jgi:N-acetylmuramoyl-L-alanine amidase
VQVVLTGSATCPRTAQYRFWVSPPGGGWTILQDYGAASTYSWRAGAGGNYRLEVDVRDAGAAAAYETNIIIPFALLGPCTTPSLSASPSGSGPTGGTVVFTASTSTCPTPNYRFWVGQNGGWTIVQNYSSSNTFTWTGTGAAGTYGVEVDVRDASSSVGYDAVRNLTYSLVGCSAAHLSTDKASPQAAGTTVVLTAGATCPGTPDYRFWVGRNGGWTIVQDFSSANTFTWSTTGKLQGTYGLEVDVRDHGSMARFEALANISFGLFAVPCTTPGLTAAPASPGGTGAHVTLTATTSACPSPQYRFWISSPTGVWSVVQDYSATNTYSWVKTGSAGTYRIEVDVRDASSSVAYDKVTMITYAVTACSTAHISANLPSPQVHGAVVVLTGSATCAGTPEYRFWVRDATGKWTIAQDYSPSNTFSWDTTTLPPGTYGLEVDVRNQGSTAPYETVANITFGVS